MITIAGKCLEREASRRYQSAAQLGEDIQRYLTDQPILACPPSATDQFRKLVARHKAAFGLAATVFVLVSALAVTSTVQAARTARSSHPSYPVEELVLGRMPQRDRATARFRVKWRGLRATWVGPPPFGTQAL